MKNRCYNEEKQSQLLEIIKQMATFNESESIDERKLKYIADLKKLYESNFRHKYSTFFTDLKAINDNGNCEGFEHLGILLNAITETLNEEVQCLVLENIGDYNNPDRYEREKLRDVKIGIDTSILKLCDHLLLEISRINSFGIYEEDKVMLESLRSEMKSRFEDVEKISTKLKKVKSEISKTQSNIITILGIFSAIVMAVAAGLSFESGIISSLTNNVHIMKIAFMAILTGIILFDLLYFLFYAIGRINDKEIFNSQIIFWLINLVFLLVLIIMYFAVPAIAAMQTIIS